VGGDTDGGRREGVKGDIGVRLTFCQCRPLPRRARRGASAAATRSYLVFFDWDNGYTDTSDTPQYNMGLSLRRAHAVAGELVRDGVPASASSIRGLAKLTCWCRQPDRAAVRMSTLVKHPPVSGLAQSTHSGHWLTCGSDRGLTLKVQPCKRHEPASDTGKQRSWPRLKLPLGSRSAVAKRLVE
jgi:hypothetical protein